MKIRVERSIWGSDSGTIRRRPVTPTTSDFIMIIIRSMWTRKRRTASNLNAALSGSDNICPCVCQLLFRADGKTLEEETVAFNGAEEKAEADILGERFVERRQGGTVKLNLARGLLTGRREDRVE